MPQRALTPPLSHEYAGEGVKNRPTLRDTCCSSALEEIEFEIIFDIPKKTSTEVIPEPPIDKAKKLVAMLFTGVILTSAISTTGCSLFAPKDHTPTRELTQYAPENGPRVVAVAPAINISGERGVDALIQADLVFQQIGQVEGWTAVPVNRVAEVYAGLGIRQVQNEADANLVCDKLGVDALIVPTITLYNPYDPPKLGASLALFVRNSYGPNKTELNVHQLSREATGSVESLPRNADFIQAAGVFDASVGSVQSAIGRYASGRIDSQGPLQEREITLSMSQYSGFVWHELLGEVLDQLD
ncbi:MAG TPA: hypothetical protein PK402_08305 [Tepidisphaeraceae bacterium]|nr:hypothetical protein [Tepidisphaeraceae bacterium]